MKMIKMKQPENSSGSKDCVKIAGIIIHCYMKDHTATTCPITWLPHLQKITEAKWDNYNLEVIKTIQVIPLAVY